MADYMPKGAQYLMDRCPTVWMMYERLGQACAESGPLDERSRRLVKLALAIGAGSEGAVHSHTRRGLAEGMTVSELEHVAVLAIPTLGLPRAVAAMCWIRDLCPEQGTDSVARQLSAQTVPGGSRLDEGFADTGDRHGPPRHVARRD